MLENSPARQRTGQWLLSNTNSTTSATDPQLAFFLSEFVMGASGQEATSGVFLFPKLHLIGLNDRA